METTQSTTLPAWAGTASPFSGPWSEVLAYSDWYRLYPEEPPFDRVTPLREVLVRQNPLGIPEVLRNRGLVDSPLGRLIDGGPSAFARTAAAIRRDEVQRTLHALEEGDLVGPSEHRASVLFTLLSDAAAAATADIVALALKKRAAAPVAPQFYAPIYLSNACTNHCTYCGFHVKNETPRHTLEDEALRAEAQHLVAAGHRNVLLLTGESPKIVPLDRLESAVRLLAEYFESVGLEVYPLDEEGYRRLRAAGATSLTVYQETYDVGLYRQVHRAGRKRNFLHRLGTPERGARGGLGKVSLGALLGLGDPAFEGYALGLHALELEARYPSLRLGVSFPRMRPADSEIPVPRPVGDAEFLRLVAALRLVFPEIEFSLSTRESAAFRDLYGPTLFDWVSAGCSTEPGGYASASKDHRALPQFTLADTRSLAEVRVAYEAAPRPSTFVLPP